MARKSPRLHVRRSQRPGIADDSTKSLPILKSRMPYDDVWCSDLAMPKNAVGALLAAKLNMVKRQISVNGWSVNYIAALNWVVSGGRCHLVQMSFLDVSNMSARPSSLAVVEGHSWLM